MERNGRADKAHRDPAWEKAGGIQLFIPQSRPLWSADAGCLALAAYEIACYSLYKLPRWISLTTQQIPD